MCVRAYVYMVVTIIHATPGQAGGGHAGRALRRRVRDLPRLPGAVLDNTYSICYILYTSLSLSMYIYIYNLYAYNE